jgi:hypothetical protein
MSRPRARIKSGKAGLIGGAAVWLASFVLRTACTHELGVDSVPWPALGADISAGIAAWTADL